MQKISYMKSVDVLFIIALSEELSVFKTIFSGLETPNHDTGLVLYHHKHERINNLPILDCCTLLIGDQGPEAASNATTSVLKVISPKLVINVGISGRVDSDMNLCDVIIASEADNPLYRSKIKSGSLKLAGKSFPLIRIAEPIAQAISEDPPQLSLLSRLSDLEIMQLRDKKYIGDKPTIHKAPIFATPHVIDDEDYVEDLLTRNRLYGAADMESGAIANACWNSDLVDGHILIVRGISDPANGKKKELDKIRGGIIREISMRNAATVAKHALQHLDLSRNRPSVLFSSNDHYIVEESKQLSISSVLNSIEGEVAKNIPLPTICTKVEEQLLQCHDRQGLLELAHDVFNSEILLTHISSNAVSNLNQTARDYLTAYHVMRCLNADPPSKQEMGNHFRPLSYVYPQRVNRFCKEMMLLVRDEQALTERLLQAAEMLGFKPQELQNRATSKKRMGGKFSVKTNPQARAHACYLLGRLNTQQQQKIASASLERWLDQVFIGQNIAGSMEWNRRQAFVRRLAAINTSQDRMLLRTILISLVQLGKNQRSEDYIKACLRDRNFDELNRGFHLEYYGDIEYDKREAMSHIDDLRPFPLTFERLFSKLEESYKSGENYPLRDIELQTLLSLCQHRHAEGKLEQNCRTRILELLGPVSTSTISSSFQLRGFVRMVLLHLGTTFNYSRMIREVYQLKKQPRTGWIHVKRGRSVKQPESIMEHIGAGALLIQHFVPNSLPQEDVDQLGQDICRSYSKDEILRIFIIHDWAEAYTGDTLSSEKSDDTRRIEEMTMSVIDNFCTYKNIEMGGTFSLWKAFEENHSINAKIAKDIDYLENLMQLELEYEENPDAIPDYLEWKIELLELIRTPLGKRISNIITKKNR